MGVPGVADVSPGFAPRPSLSDLPRAGELPRHDRVAGVRAPAFVERAAAPAAASRSAPRVAGVRAPAFVERARSSVGCPAARSGVAGVRAPAFVERGRLEALEATVSSVAGVRAPAFVERSVAADVRP